MPIHLEDITEIVRLLLVTVITDGLDEEVRMNSSIPFLSSDVQTLPEIQSQGLLNDVQTLPEVQSPG